MHQLQSPLSGAAERAVSRQNGGMQNIPLGETAHESEQNSKTFVGEAGNQETTRARVLLGLRTLFSSPVGLATSPTNSRSAEQEDSLVAATAGARLVGDHLAGESWMPAL